MASLVVPGDEDADADDKELLLPLSLLSLLLLVCDSELLLLLLVVVIVFGCGGFVDYCFVFCIRATFRLKMLAADLDILE